MADPIAAATEHLEDGEHVIASAAGRHVTDLRRPPAAILATDRRVIFYGSKLMGHLLHTFTYSQVDAIGTSKGPMGRQLVITAGGATVKLDRIKQDTAELVAAVNART